MKKIIKKVRNFFILLKADYDLRKAVKCADNRHLFERARFYVLPNWKNRLMVLRWSEIKEMRKNGYFSNEVNEASVIEESFYYTPNTFGNTLSLKKKNLKRRQWLNYIVQAKKL